MTAFSPILCLLGPTASGKTALSLRLAEHAARAGRTGRAVEIINIDSVQVYRGLDIGSAKPSVAEQAGIPHHLIDVADPSEAFTAAKFVQLAVPIIQAIQARGAWPVLVGGTMLYVKALTEGFADLPPADAALRQQLQAEAQQQGWPLLHQRLSQLDPITAAKLHPNDSIRIQRALEVCLLTGQPFSSQLQPVPPLPQQSWLKFALLPERGVLHQRIEQRFQLMMQQGFLDEVRALFERGDLHVELPAIRAAGYRQLWGYLAQESGFETLEMAVQKGIFATRQLAKRQITWIRGEAECVQGLSPDMDLNFQTLAASIKP
jgi:tRNA dimethylallyltransferase